MAEFSSDEHIRIVEALEGIASSLKSIDTKMDAAIEALNKSPWDDAKTKAILSTAYAGSGMEDELAARGVNLSE